MASLTHTAIVARKTIRYSIYGLIAIIIVRSAVNIGATVYRRYFPEPPPTPTVSYGKLPELSFPDRPVYDNLIFTLETPEGGLPKLAPQAIVYFMSKPSVNIRSVERAHAKADSLGFNPPGAELSDTVYEYRNNSYPAVLNLNIVTGVFSIDYDLTADIDTNYPQAPAPELAITQAKNYLAKAGSLPDDITGPTPHELLKINNNQFVRAISLSEANFVRVSLYRKDYNDLPSMPADPEKGNIWFIVGSSGRGGRVYAGEFHYFPINENQNATYPLRSVEQAWNELNSQGGYIASIGENPENAEIKIRRVYLAYYDAGTYHDFYQPIYVFEGDNDFYGYVPAIAEEYYGETSDTVIQE